MENWIQKIIPKWILKNLKLLLALTVTITVTVTIVINVHPPPNPPQNPPPTKDWVTQDVTATDSFGRKINLLIAILSQEKRWMLGSVNMLENNEPFDVFFPQYLKKLPAIYDCSEFIAVGVASQEGSSKYEFSRADKRADKILEILRPICGGRNLYKLNLGKYSTVKSESETSGQRRVIIIGIKNRDPAMTIEDIKYALYGGLQKQVGAKLGLQIVEYSNFYFTNPS